MWKQFAATSLNKTKLMLLYCGAGENCWEHLNHKNQPDEVKPYCRLRAVTVKQKYSGHVMWQEESLEKTLKKKLKEDKVARHYPRLNKHKVVRIHSSYWKRIDIRSFALQRMKKGWTNEQWGSLIFYLLETIYFQLKGLTVKTFIALQSRYKKAIINFDGAEMMSIFFYFFLETILILPLLWTCIWSATRHAFPFFLFFSIFATALMFCS